MSLADDLRTSLAKQRQDLFWACAERMYADTLPKVRAACTDVLMKTGRSALKEEYVLHIPDGFDAAEAEILTAVLQDGAQLLHSPSFKALRSIIVSTFVSGLQGEGMTVRRASLSSGDGSIRLYLSLSW